MKKNRTDEQRKENFNLFITELQTISMKYGVLVSGNFYISDYTLIEYRRDHTSNDIDPVYETKTEIEVGDDVTIPNDLTTDPFKRRGQTGKVTRIDDGDVAKVVFEDNKCGYYLIECLILD